MLVYIGILIAKIIEVSFTTLRTVMISKGKRKEAAMFSIIENIIWLTVVTNVISTIKEDPLKMVFYVIGYALGIFLGGYIENKLAIGEMSLICIVDDEKSSKLINHLRSEGLPVTVIDAEGLKSKKKLLYIIFNRKDKESIIKEIHSITPNATITVTDEQPLQAYGLK